MDEEMADTTVTAEDDALFQKVLTLVTRWYFRDDTIVQPYVTAQFTQKEKLDPHDEWPSEYRMDLKPATTGSPLIVHLDYLKDCTSFSLHPAYINGCNHKSPCAFALRIDDYLAEEFYIHNTLEAGKYLVSIFPKEEGGSIKTEPEAASPVAMADLLQRLADMLAELPST